MHTHIHTHTSYKLSCHVTSNLVASFFDRCRWRLMYKWQPICRCSSSTALGHFALDVTCKFTFCIPSLHPPLPRPMPICICVHIMEYVWTHQFQPEVPTLFKPTRYRTIGYIYAYRPGTWFICDTEREFYHVKKRKKKKAFRYICIISIIYI